MFVIYDLKTTAIVKARSSNSYRETTCYKSLGAAKAALTRMSKKAHENLSTYSIDTDPQFIYGIAESEHYLANIERQVTRTGIAPGTGKEVTLSMSINQIGSSADPFTERYWTM